jgi:hypothetical protein
MEQRQDVKKKMEARASYRRLRRSEKRYREKRFSNRKNSKRKGRIAPSILQKRQAIVRLVMKLLKWVPISQIVLEDVAIDIRALTEGYTLYRWQYQKSNRLDENLRKATIMRDGNKCQMCKKGNRMLQAHHIVPRRAKGADTLSNLITLCTECHDAIAGREHEYMEKFQKMISGKHIRFDYAQHVMQGKHWLRARLSEIAPLVITDGGTTANQRIDWGVEKSHANDAAVMTGLIPSKLAQKDWWIRPKRKRRKMKNTERVCGFQHGDIAKYTDSKGVAWLGYVTAMYVDKAQINVQSKTKHLKRVNAKKAIFVGKCPQISIL